MGGRIWVESVPGPGSTFHFSARFGLHDRPLAAAPLAQPKDLQDLPVLVVDDNATNRRILEEIQKYMVRLFQKWGQRVTIAANGREALAAVEREPFDLVLMDVQMPEMGGFEATAAIRKREQNDGRHTSIIAMTAHAMKGDRERCLEAGMDGYISKPVQARELFELVDQVIPAPVQTDQSSDDLSLSEEGVDWTAALRIVGNDCEILGEIVAVFLDEYPRWLAQMRAAFAVQAAPALRRVAHTIKGSLAQFGACSAARAAQRLETMGEKGVLTDAERALSDREKELERVQPAMAKFASAPRR
jgi:CheY-like chemotaxis protein/HPt (histidine-containing phosphotransfer) domain-containing protein